MEMIKSEQIRIGLQKSFQSDKSAKASTACYGYRVSPSGELSVDSAEAKTVAFIFERFSKGNSLGKISDALDRMGIDSPTGKKVIIRQLSLMSSSVLCRRKSAEGAETESSGKM